MILIANNVERIRAVEFGKQSVRGSLALCRVKTYKAKMAWVGSWPQKFTKRVVYSEKAVNACGWLHTALCLFFLNMWGRLRHDALSPACCVTINSRLVLMMSDVDLSFWQIGNSTQKHGFNVFFFSMTAWRVALYTDSILPHARAVISWGRP